RRSTTTDGVRWAASPAAWGWLVGEVTRPLPLPAAAAASSAARTPVDSDKAILVLRTAEVDEPGDQQPDRPCRRLRPLHRVERGVQEGVPGDVDDDEDRVGRQDRARQLVADE